MKPGSITKALICRVLLCMAPIAIAACGGSDGGSAVDRIAAGVTPTSVTVAAVSPSPATAPDKISAGFDHACALLDGGLWCWGSNQNGQLGNNSTSNSAAAVSVQGMLSGVDAISAGTRTTCAVRDGSVWCWGWNLYGQQGAHTPADSIVPVAVSKMSSGVTEVTVRTHAVCVVMDGSVACGSPGGPGATLGDLATQGLPELAGFTNLSGPEPDDKEGAQCALKDRGVWCWGGNFFGQLGNNGLEASPAPVAVSGMSSGVSDLSAGGLSACAVKDGGVWCWGDNFNGKLGIARTDDCGGDPCSRVPLPVLGMASGVTSISTNGNYTCAVKDGGAWCWGFGNGIGRTEVRAPSVVPELASDVSAISVGGNHACAIKGTSGWCWGVNDQSQLGNNSTADSITVPVAVMGLPGGRGVPVSTATPTVAAAATEVDRLMAAIRATYPDLGFDPACSTAAPTATCIGAGPWSTDTLAGGIARVYLHDGEGAVLLFFGRMADGSWAYWAFISNAGGGPLVVLPGDAMICADGDGLNLRTEPSTSAPKVVLLPDGAMVRADRFVLTEPSPPSRDNLPVHGHGWYHIVSPQEGWAYDRYLVPKGQHDSAGAPADVTGFCTAQWWPRDP